MRREEYGLIMTQLVIMASIAHANHTTVIIRNALASQARRVSMCDEVVPSAVTVVMTLMHLSDECVNGEMDGRRAQSQRVVVLQHSTCPNCGKEQARNEPRVAF
mmetsp:Transcript_20/g.27  ORF Transcript_20/g.27 Transcript_20/m.27 type:complete len:104 (-) Transcript_20:58-369(-)